MKRILAGICMIFMGISISACSSQETSAPADANGTNEAAASTTQATLLDIGDTTLTEQILYDQDDIKITAKGWAEGTIQGPEVSLELANNSGKSVTLQTKDSLINGYMANVTLFTEVPASTTMDGLLVLSQKDIIEAGIDKIGEVGFKLVVLDTENYEELHVSERIMIQTNHASSMVADTTIEGVSIYDKNGIKIIAKQSIIESVYGPELILYIENQSQTPIRIQSQKALINGTPTDSFLLTTVIEGGKTLEPLTFFKSVLDEALLKDMKTVDLSISIMDANTGAAIDEVPVTSIEIKK